MSLIGLKRAKAGRVAALLVVCGAVFAVWNATSAHAAGVMAPARTVLEAREEMQQLLDGSLQIAAMQLQKEGTFFPFMAGMTDTGQIQIVGIPAEEKRPDIDVMLEALRKAARQLTRQQRFRAVALYVDFVAVRKDAGIEQPGIRIEMEHVYPDSLTVFVPYLINQNKQIRLMTPQFMPGRHPYFFISN